MLPASLCFLIILISLPIQEKGEDNELLLVRKTAGCGPATLKWNISGATSVYITPDYELESLLNDDMNVHINREFQEKGAAVTRWDEKVRVSVGNVSLELPISLVKRQDTPIDSVASVFEGSGVTVIVDQGPFANRLDSYAGHPEYQEMIKDVSGTTSRTISFQSPDRGTYTVATHLAAPKHVTVVVQADASVPEQVPREIIESLRLLD